MAADVACPIEQVPVLPVVCPVEQVPVLPVVCPAEVAVGVPCLEPLSPALAVGLLLLAATFSHVAFPRHGPLGGRRGVQRLRQALAVASRRLLG